MTGKELCSNLGIYFFVFDDELYEDEAFYIPGIRTIFLSDRITEGDRVKTILHELGHRSHLPHLYSIFREKYEIQANRHMIHYLMEAELEVCEDKEQFNYLDFMEKYKLKTIADEMMVKKEFYNLIKVG